MFDGGLFAGTVHDYMLVTGSDHSSTADESNQAEMLQPTAARSVLESLSPSASLTPPPRPPPPRHLPHRHEHCSSLPPALPPKEQHGMPSLASAETAAKQPARIPPARIPLSLSHVEPPPLPQPRQKRKDASLVIGTRSAVADRLANKVAPPLPVDSDGTECKDEVSSAPQAIRESRNLTVPKSDRHAARDQMQVGLDAAAGGLKCRTLPRDSSSECHWPRVAAVSSSKASVGLPLDTASASECSVCLEQPVDCVLYTCGHMCMCYDCAVGVHRASIDGGSCPICRQAIKDVIKIYRS